MAQIMTPERIHLLAARNNAQRYLEIGVNRGATFFEVALPKKIAVDPNFLFDPSNHSADNTFYEAVTSDDFFEQLTQKEYAQTFMEAGDTTPTFDIIFLDGLHTFEQTLRDFENSLKHAHEKTIWVIDDTVPSDPYSALPDAALSMQYRKAVGFYGESWHGDVYKVIFAIHDLYPEFSYCTVMNGNNPQTIVWKAPIAAGKKALFPSQEDIARLSYFDMLQHAHIMYPVVQGQVDSLLYTTLNPADKNLPNVWKNLLYCQPRIITDLQLVQTVKEQLLKDLRNTLK